MSSSVFNTEIVTHTGTGFTAAPSSSLAFNSAGVVATPSPSAFATGSSSSASATGESTGPLASIAGVDAFFDLYATLNVALSLLLFGLFFAAIAFGAVCTKATAYARQRPRRDGILTQLVVAGLVLLNIVQMAFTMHAVYTAVVVDFGGLNDLLNQEWSITVQIGIMTFIASITQSFFIYRLHAAKHYASLTIIALLFTLLQLALSIYSVVQMFEQDYVTVMLVDVADVWPMTATFSISGALNIVLAALGYIWLQKPYKRKFRSRSSFVDGAEYWLLKSLFFCGILSLYNAVGVSIMGLNFSWLAVTFVLGNLYTLSVLLNVTERYPVAPFMLSVSPVPHSDDGSTRRASTITLTPNSSLWDDIIKAQLMYSEEPVPATIVTDDKERHILGYHTVASAV